MKKLLPFFLACFLLASAAQGTDITEEVIAAGSDDGHETNDGTMNITGGVVYMKDASQEWGGFRFTTVPIPQGATITSATISIRVQTTVNDDPAVSIFANDVDDAETFTTDDYNMSTRAITSDSVYWEATGLGTGYHDTPDLSVVVQEIVDRDNWASGNDLAFLWRCESGSKLYAYAYEAGTPSLYAAKFNCSYTTEEPSAGQVIIIGEKSDFHRPPTAEVNWRDQ